MTRNETIDALIEGYIKDVLTYDLSKHHPRPHERFRFNNAARKAKVKAREVFRNKPKGKYDTQPIDVSKYVSKAKARRAPGIKVPKGYHPKLKMSSARRKGPTARQQKGRKAVLGAAAAIGAGIVAHKAYKYHKAKKKREMRENDLGNFSVAPTAAVDASPIHKEQRDRYWMIKNRKKIKNMTVKEVFDDTYSSGVLGRAAQVEKSTNLIAKARKLKSLVAKVKKLNKESQQSLYLNKAQMKVPRTFGKKFGSLSRSLK